MDTPETAAHEPVREADDSWGDYSYDMAHDAMLEPPPLQTARTGVPPTHESRQDPAPEVGGDYSYDLAHEVPPATA